LKQENPISASSPGTPRTTASVPRKSTLLSLACSSVCEGCLVEAASCRPSISNQCQVHDAEAQHNHAEEQDVKHVACGYE
jgi:hypothetical protein